MQNDVAPRIRGSEDLREKIREVRGGEDWRIYPKVPCDL